jgi:hypothetical protein
MMAVSVRGCSRPAPCTRCCQYATSTRLPMGACVAYLEDARDTLEDLL